MEIRIPEPSLVLLVGVSGCGKSTFARRHFGPYEVLSSDVFRGMVSDDETDQSATRDAFEVLHEVAARRLRRGRVVVVDATNVQPMARFSLVALARRWRVAPVALVLDLPEPLCRERNRLRADRSVGDDVIHRQVEQLRRSLPALGEEGFQRVHVLRTEHEVATAVILREPAASPPSPPGPAGG